MQVLPPVQLARSRVRGAAVREGRAPARPPRARRAMDPRRLGRDKRDPPVRRIRRVTMWCRGRGRRPRRPVRPMAFPCTCRASSVATSATLPCPARNGPAPPSVATSATLPYPARNGPAPPSAATSATLPSARRPMDPRRPRSRQARPSRARRPMDPRRPRSRQARPSRSRRAMDPRRLGRDKRDPPVPGTQWTRAASVATSAPLPCPARKGPVPPRSRQARPSRAPYPPGYHVVPW